MNDQELLRRAMNGEVFGNGQKQIALLVAEISILEKALAEVQTKRIAAAIEGSRWKSLALRNIEQRTP